MNRTIFLSTRQSYINNTRLNSRTLATQNVIDLASSYNYNMDQNILIIYDYLQNNKTEIIIRQQILESLLEYTFSWNCSSNLRITKLIYDIANSTGNISLKMINFLFNTAQNCDWVVLCHIIAVLGKLKPLNYAIDQEELILILHNSKIQQSAKSQYKFRIIQDLEQFIQSQGLNCNIDQILSE
ncbi:Hypothetical_protein [Hexamita inflata]|uniref:Hypothetical_protein n=1 Tax=Hexamita inflata TaxID=28002 RepID=A0AA86NSS0_9EUKA|nr:Hypothetical protein HINF_LOCUS11801 [Hexamita inflata]